MIIKTILKESFYAVATLVNTATALYFAKCLFSVGAVPLDAVGFIAYSGIALVGWVAYYLSYVEWRNK